MADYAAAPPTNPCSVDNRENFVAQMRSVPGPVAIVCSANGESRTGMAVTAWNSLCADPPMLLVCVNRQASAHNMITNTGRFSVNLLATNDIETVAIFSAQRGLSGADRFLDGQWRDGQVGQPMLKNAVAAFECELAGSHSYGTHDIFIGRVLHMNSMNAATPLLYLDGKYCEPTQLREAKQS